MKIILADPPDIRTPWLIANHPNLGILYLIASLRRTFPAAQVLYLESFLSLKQHLERVAEFAPNIYGISFASLRTVEAFTAIRRVRKLRPQTRIFCGGPHPSAQPRQVLEETPADLCVIGEGEQTICDLVRNCADWNAIDGVDGILFKRHGQLCQTARRALIRNLDEIPLPAWDAVDFTHYTGNYQYKGSPSTALIASRGCPYDCVFCSNPVWKTSKPYLRLRSAGNIVTEVDWLYRLGIREISIRSDEFNPVLPWTLDVCKSLAGMERRDLYFQANLRADKVTDELAQALKQANFWLVQLGIESGNQRTLDGIGKHITLDQIVAACRCFKRHGLSVYGYIMTYHVWEEKGRLCHETSADVDRTFAFVRWLKREGLLDYMSLSTTTPMPGARLYEIARRHKIWRNGAAPRDMSELHMDLPGVTGHDLKRSRRRGIRLQLSINLRSRQNNLFDWRKNWHKVKTLVRSF